MPTSSRKGTSSSATSAFAEDVYDRTTRKENDDLAMRSKIVPKLAKRAYHLEAGNTWLEDWKQYQKNTHPVFGLCWHHRLHPVRFPQRIIVLVGSIAFGFALTNCVYLGFLGQEEAGDAVNYIYDATGRLAEFQKQYTNIDINQTVIFLVTIGSCIHSMFDMLIWYLMACFCFREGGKFKNNRHCQRFGIYIGVLVVVLAVVAATSVVIVRLTEDENGNADSSAAEKFAEDTILDGGDETESESKKFSFLVGYALELVFALFVFYFITSTIFFSGILGCFRIPVLGGRPYEIRREKENANDDDADWVDEDGVICLAVYEI